MSSGYNNFDPSRAGRPGSGPSRLRHEFDKASYRAVQVLKIAALAGLALDATSNAYDHQKLFPNEHLLSVDTAVYVGYHTGKDILHGAEHVGYAVLDGYAHVTNKPALPHLIGSPEMETMCVPASLAHEGWDNPQSAKMAAYKKDAEGRVKQLAGFVYYANERRNSDAHYGIPPVQYMIMDKFNSYKPALTGQAKFLQQKSLVDDIALTPGAAETCPAGQNLYQVDISASPQISPRRPY